VVRRDDDIDARQNTGKQALLPHTDVSGKQRSVMAPLHQKNATPGIRLNFRIVSKCVGQCTLRVQKDESHAVYFPLLSRFTPLRYSRRGCLAGLPQHGCVPTQAGMQIERGIGYLYGNHAQQTVQAASMILVTMGQHQRIDMLNASCP
jgi:hypothetical protein